MELLLLIVCWWRLLPKWLIISLRFFTPLIVPTLMHVLIIISTSYNIIVTTLIDKGVKIHGSKRK
ncbi:hypothetical protein AHAS_Ahas13G0299600 [Arachis hypogaea]